MSDTNSFLPLRTLPPTPLLHLGLVHLCLTPIRFASTGELNQRTSECEAGTIPLSYAGVAELNG